MFVNFVKAIEIIMNIRKGQIMATRIDSIWYFDFTNKIAFYDSIRDFTSLEMRYLATAISTEKIRVNATPTEFKIDENGSSQIREYVISNISQLVEVSEELALNSPRYLSVLYADDTTKYFKYDEAFCQIFSTATSHKIEPEKSEPIEPSPYAIQKEPEPSPYAIQKDNVTKHMTYEKPINTNPTSNKAKKKDNKSLLIDIAILLSVWGPLLFIIIGGINYINGGFDGTLMEELFPAIFLGFFAGFITLIIISNILKNASMKVWLIPAVIMFFITVITDMLKLENFLVVELIALCGITLLMVVIVNIKDKL